MNTSTLKGFICFMPPLIVTFSILSLSVCECVCTCYGPLHRQQNLPPVCSQVDTQSHSAFPWRKPLSRDYCSESKRDLRVKKHKTRTFRDDLKMEYFKFRVIRSKTSTVS